MIQLWNKLEELENENSYSGKEVILKHIINDVSDGEEFLRLAFNDSVYGLKERSFMNALHIEHLEGKEHVSDLLAVKDFSSDNRIVTINPLKFEVISDLAEKMLEKSGYDQLMELKAYFYDFTQIEKKWICRLLLHDLRCGVKVKTVNRVLRELGKPIIEKFAMQLCESIDNLYDETEVEKYITFPCAIEIKYDGIRLQAHVKEGKCKLTSRRGKDRTENYPEIVEELEQAFKEQNIILDGEITARSFQALTRKDDESTRKYVVFDLLNDETLDYNSRWTNLLNLFNLIEFKNIELARHHSAANIKDLQQFYEYANEQKEEGIIIKLYDRPYERGSRKHMFKVKKSYTADLKIIGYKYGEGKRANKVATLELEDASGLRVDVGSGIDDEICEHLTDEVQKSENPPSFIGEIVEILYNEKTETGSLRFPRFVKFRDDKVEPDDLSNFEIRQGDENVVDN